MKHLLLNIFPRRSAFKFQFQYIFCIELLLCFSFIYPVLSQDGPQVNLGNFVGVPTGIMFNEILDPQWLANNADKGFVKNGYSGIKGSPFFNDDPAEGFILFKNQKLAKEVKLRYSLYDNELYFLDNGKEWTLSNMNDVAQFGIYNDKENRYFIFRNGFPPVNKNTAATFYTYTSTGRITLLRLFNKSLMQATNASGAPEMKFINDEKWFIYQADTFNMKEIKKSKNALIMTLPGFADKIETIIKQQNLNLKNSADWDILFAAMNN